MMSDWLHADFLQGKEQYVNAETFWGELWQRALTQTGVAEEWQSPWIANPIADGNPILTAISKTRSRAIRIVQEEYRDPEDVDLDWWVESVGEDIRELVVACSPSRGNIAAVEQLLTRWLENGEVPMIRESRAMTYNQLDRLLDELGFERTRLEPKWLRYLHADTNTEIILVEKASTAPVRPTDEWSAREHLIRNGFIEEDALEEWLRNHTPTLT